MKDTINDIKIKVIKEEKSTGGERDSAVRSSRLKEYLSEKEAASQDPIFISTEDQYKPSGLVKFLSRAGKLIAIFLIGGAGGVWMEHNIIPVLATKDPFNRYDFFKKIRDRTVIINRTEEVKISEDSAAMDMVRKTAPSVVKIAVTYNFLEKPVQGRKKAASTEVLETRNLNGVIITSDGLILTADPKVFTTNLAKFDLKSAVYKISYSDKEFTVSDANAIITYDSKAKPSDPRAKILLLKIKTVNLPVIALAVSSSDAEAGQKVFALGNNLFSGVISEVRTEDGVQLIGVDNTPSANYFGSGPLVNLKGELMGINISDSQGKPTSRFISVDDLKDFINSAIGV